MQISCLANNAINNPLQQENWNIKLNPEHLQLLFRQHSFWTDVLKNWMGINTVQPIGYHEVLDEFIWYNSEICVGRKPIFYQQWYEKGVSQVKHLRVDNRWLNLQEFNQKYDLQAPLLQYLGLLQAIPHEWNICLRDKEDTTHRPNKLEEWKKYSNRVAVIYRNLTKQPNLLHKKWFKVSTKF